MPNGITVDKWHDIDLTDAKFARELSDYVHPERNGSSPARQVQARPVQELPREEAGRQINALLSEHGYGQETRDLAIGEIYRLAKEQENQRKKHKPLCRVKRLKPLS